MSKRIFIYIFLLGTVFAQQAQTEIKLVDVIVSGNIIVSEQTILFTAGLRKNNSIMPTEFPRAIKRLWQLGLFKDIQILYEAETEEGLSITIEVEENPILGEIIFKGNKKLKDSKLEEEIGMSAGQRIKPNTLHAMSKKLTALYSEDGYLKAEITAELVKPEIESKMYQGKAKNLVYNMVFHIKENQKIKIKNIVFEGNESFPDWRLRWQLKETKEQRWYLFWRSTFDDSKFDEDKEKISTFYKNHGYRDFEVLSDTIQYDEASNKMNIVFRLREGPQYKFRNFTWEGYTLFEEELFHRALGISKGDEYNEQEFNLAVYERIQGLYMDRGYIYSRVEPQITPIGEDSLDVNFVITENHKVYIRNILVSGNSKTRENVIRRRLRIFPGDIFNRDRLQRSQREVWMLNYFSNVVPEVLPVDEDEVDLEIVVEEKSAGKANANIGFTQTYGMTGGGGVELPNFRGKGQRLNFSFNVGTNYNFYSATTPPKYKSFNISFTDPMVNDTKNLLGFSLFYSFRGRSSQYYYPLDFTIAGGSTSWGRLFKWPDDFFRGNWSFQMVQKNYDGSQEDLDLYVKGLSTSIGINLTQSIRRDSRDRPEFTTQGSLFSLTSTISGGPLGGNEDFHKHVLGMEYYTPTVWKFVLMSTFKIGVIEPLSSSDGEQSIVPFDERFIMGGNGIPNGNSLRGYDDNRVGPLTSSGSPIGGNTMIKIVNEFRVPFSENPVVYGLAFAEMGNVWASLDMEEKFSLPRRGPLDLKKSAGIGVRFFMPMIGMLGFDLGYGFDDLNGDGSPEGWKTTITFGQQF
ncbi:MAG: outer membrane protein assembly factor BamA [Candidatus Marinimicrobia bacterium]|nr:outer membrane protein assembly factor BamA [Candidatus Neomarinimicrobiota bacterium]MBT6736854.1 outer membrane protein assembly factor BamA [Candidatus Neomarinimicrobiota bacterium]